MEGGGSAILKCSATGVPPPDISWQKDSGSDFPVSFPTAVFLVFIIFLIFKTYFKLMQAASAWCRRPTRTRSFSSWRPTWASTPAPPATRPAAYRPTSRCRCWRCRGETQGMLLFLFIFKIIICSTPAQVCEAHAGQVGVGRRDGGGSPQLRL